MSVEGALWEGWPEATAVGQAPLCYFFTAEAEYSLLEAHFMVSMPKVKAPGGRRLYRLDQYHAGVLIAD